MIIKSGCLLAASVRFMHKIFMAHRNCVRLCFSVCVSGLFDKKKFRVALLISRWEMYCISPSVLLQHTRWIHAPRSFLLLSSSCDSCMACDKVWSFALQP